MAYGWYQGIWLSPISILDLCRCILYGRTYMDVDSTAEYRHTRLLVQTEIVHSQTDVTEVTHRRWWAYEGITRLWLYYPHPQGVGLDSPAWVMCWGVVTLVFNVTLHFLTDRHCTESGPAYRRVMAIWSLACSGDVRTDRDSGSHCHAPYTNAQTLDWCTAIYSLE